MEIAKLLYQLQESASKIESTSKALNHLTAQLGESQEVLKAEAELASEHQRLEELKKQQHSTEWDIDDLGAKISTLENKLYGGGVASPKELSSLQADTRGLKTRLRQLEDKTLGIMEQTEQAEAKVKAASESLEGLKARWQNQQQELSVEIERVRSALVGLEQEHQQLVDRIDPQAVDFYSRLKKQKGQAISRVEQGVCSACRIILPVTDLQRVKSGNLVQCSSCGRILFLA